MSSHSIVVIPLAYCAEHSARCCIALGLDFGWDVSLEIDDRVVSTTHCTDWHRVERLCESIKTAWERRSAASWTSA